MQISRKISKLLNAGFICLVFSAVLSAGPADRDKNLTVSPHVKYKSEWMFSKQLECNSDRGSYKYFFLDEDVYRFTDGNLADLRIVDSDGEQAPYFIEQGSTEYKTREIIYKSRKIGENFNWKEKRASFDFQIIPGDRAFVGRTLILTISRENFSRQIVLYGRQSNTEWEIIKKDSIYRFEKYAKDRIEFDSELGYLFYRVEIIDAVHGDSISSLVLIGSALTRYDQLYQKKSLEYSVKNEETSTLFMIKNPYRLKIFNLSFKISGVFNRRFDLYTEAETEVLDRRQKRIEKRTNRIIDGSLYNFEFRNTAVSNLSIDLASNTQNADNIFLRIFNNNDKPLDVRSIQVLYYIDKVVFKSVKGKRYIIYFGNNKAARPVYDIETYRKHVYRETMDKCSTGSLEGKIPDSDKQPYISEKIQNIILNIIIGIVSILLIFFIAKKLSKKE